MSKKDMLPSKIAAQWFNAIIVPKGKCLNGLFGLLLVTLKTDDPHELLLKLRAMTHDEINEIKTSLEHTITHIDPHKKNTIWVYNHPANALLYTFKTDAQNRVGFNPSLINDIQVFASEFPFTDQMFISLSEDDEDSEYLTLAQKPSTEKLNNLTQDVHKDGHRNAMNAMQVLLPMVSLGSLYVAAKLVATQEFVND